MSAKHSVDANQTFPNLQQLDLTRYEGSSGLVLIVYSENRNGTLGSSVPCSTYGMNTMETDVFKAG